MLWQHICLRTKLAKLPLQYIEMTYKIVQVLILEPFFVALHGHENSLSCVRPLVFYYMVMPSYNGPRPAFKLWISTVRPEQNGRPFADHVFKCTFFRTKCLHLIQLFFFRFPRLSFMWIRLTQWGRVMHMCVSKLTIIGSDNGLSPARRHVIIWTNQVILLTHICVTRPH